MKSKNVVMTSTEMLQSPAFRNLQPVDIGLTNWKSKRVHQENIILTLWVILQRDKSRKDYVRVHSKRLEALGGRNYAKYLGWLIREGFLEMAPQYIPGKASRRYHIPGRTQKLEHFTLHSNRRIKQPPKLSSMTELETETFRNLMTLECDLVQAELIWAGIQPAAQLNAGKAILKLANQSFSPTESEKTGRVSSVVTYLNSPLRKALSWQGEEIISVDVVNSQPLCLAALAGCPNYQAVVEAGQIYEEIQQAIGVSDRDLAKEAFMAFAYGPICTTALTTAGKNAEEIAANNPVSRKSIRRKAATLRKKGLHVPEDETLRRGLAKKRLKKELRARTAAFFKARFPEVAGVLDSLKSRQSVTTNKTATYKAAAWKLQRVEAEAVLGGCFLPLARQGIPVLSVHDCLLTTPPYVRAVKHAMAKGIEAHLSRIAGHKMKVGLKAEKMEQELRRDLQKTGRERKKGGGTQGLCSAF